MITLRPGNDSSRRVGSAALRVALGLVLVLIDFRFDGLDLFPDVLGYILLILALGDLRSIQRAEYEQGIYTLAVVGSWVSALISLGSCFAHPRWPGMIPFIFGAIEAVTGCGALAVMAVTCSGAGMQSAAACWRRAAWLWMGLSIVPVMVLAVVGAMTARSNVSDLVCAFLGVAIVEVCLLLHAAKETRRTLGTRECAKCRLRLGFDPDQVCPVCQVCPRCGYDVASIPSDTCPECGSRLARLRTTVDADPLPPNS